MFNKSYQCRNTDCWIDETLLWDIIALKLSQLYKCIAGRLTHNTRLTPPFILMKCLYQCRNVSGRGYRFCLFLRLFYLILELFRHNGIFSPLIYKWLLRPLFFQCYKAYQKCEVSTKLDIYRSCLLVNYRGLCECCPFLCYLGFF